MTACTHLPPSGGLWRQSMARITGAPPHIRIAHVGDPDKPPPHTFGQIHRNPKLWAGPLGPYYSSGLVAANHVFYATQEADWRWGSNALFAGLQGIADWRDRGRTWAVRQQTVPRAAGQSELGDSRQGRLLRRRLRVRDRHRAGVQRRHADHRPQPARRRRYDRSVPVAAAVGLDRSRRPELAGASRPRHDALARFLELVRARRVDPFVEGPSDVSPQWRTTRRCTATC